MGYGSHNNQTAIIFQTWGNSNTTGDGDAFRPAYFRANFIIYSGPSGA